jgi:hypothetical protein
MWDGVAVEFSAAKIRRERGRGKLLGSKRRKSEYKLFNVTVQNRPKQSRVV